AFDAHDGALRALVHAAHRAFVAALLRPCRERYEQRRQRDQCSDGHENAVLRSASLHPRFIASRYFCAAITNPLSGKSLKIASKTICARSGWCILRRVSPSNKSA